MPWRTPTSPTTATAPTSSAASACPPSASWPTSPPAKSETYTPAEYKKLWEEKNCRPMTAAEEKNLARGCIGVTVVELGSAGYPNPDLSNSYATFDQAKKRAAAMAAGCNKSGSEPMIFSKRFFSGGKPYTPDPKTGKVDMSGYDYKAKPGFVNFDYGFYDEDSDSWWHANHSEPGMKVYRSTEAHYSRPLGDFDKQIYGVSCGKH